MKFSFSSATVMIKRCKSSSVFSVTNNQQHLWCDDKAHKGSAVAEMGNRVATIDMGRKVGAMPLFRGS